MKKYNKEITGYEIGSEEMERFKRKMREDERSLGTIEKYERDIRQFLNWLGERLLTKDVVIQWREELAKQGYRPVSINGKLAALNYFLGAQGWMECRVKALKIQRKIFCEERRELTKEEYGRLLREAERCGKERLKLLMETICGTGIRVSEVKYITVEATRQRRAEVRLKGKIRVILLPAKLCRKLEKYAKKHRIRSGEIFVTKTGKSLSRKQIWAEMKKICEKAKVESSKVFPHNLRHLFARCFYKACHDLSRLADILGHSSVETTRIYLVSSGTEHAKTLEQLRLIS